MPKTVTFSSDGQLLASTNIGGLVKFWRLNSTSIVLQVFQDQKALAVSFHPSDNQLVACAQKDGTVEFWSINGIKQNTFQPSFSGVNSGIASVCFSPDGRRLAATNWETVFLWSVNSTKPQNFYEHAQRVNSVIFSPDGQMNIKIQYVSFSPDGQILASAGLDETVKLWSIDGTELHTFRGHTDTVNSVAFSPDGQVLASASEDGTVILWNLNLDNLLMHSCNWLRDYLKTNPNVSESERHLCDGIGTQK